MRNQLPIASLVAILISVSDAAAQPAALDGGRAAVAVIAGLTRTTLTTVDCCELRTPPSLRGVDTPSTVRAIGGEVRWRFNRYTNAFAQVERLGRARLNLSFPRPGTQPFPFVSYESERRISQSAWSVTGGPSFELRANGRVRPRVFGSLAIQRIAESQDSVSLQWSDRTLASTTRTEWHRHTILIGTGAGATIYLTHNAFLTSELAWNVWTSARCTDCAGRRIRTESLSPRRAASFRCGAGISF